MASKLIAFRNHLSGMRSDLLVGRFWERLLCASGKRLHSSTPHTKELIDQQKTPVGHGSAGVEDNACGNGSRNDNHAVLCASQEDSNEFDIGAYLRKDLDVKNWGVHDGKAVYLNGVYYDSPSDPNFIRARNEDFCKIVATFQLETKDPNDETLYETLCKLRGRRPFYEHPEYENEPKPVYGP